ncbi:MAG: IS21 family transposase [Gammaproteobacteria bacterium]
MISYETFCKIHDYHQHRGLTVTQIARELGLDPKTVGKWVETKSYRPRAASPRPSKLDPFKPQVVRLLESHPYSATQVFQRLRDEGYSGGFSILKAYVRKVRPVRKPAFLTLSFEPGECAQVDWGEYGTVNVGNTRRKLSFFVMVLCYSRLMYLEFTLSQTLEHFLNCHQNAFQYFGGVVKKVMLDNLKTAVLRRLIGEAPVFNPRYLDFSRHFGFDIVACNVAKGNEKGRVENGVGYVKKNFLNGLDIPDFSTVNPAGKNWLESIANVRTHGETRERPIDRFQPEKSALSPLPGMPYDVGAIHLVRASNRFRVTLDTNRYSVPSEYASTRLTLKAYPEHLVVYHQDKLIARHVRSYDRHQDFENPDHPRELLAQRRKAREQTLLRRFLALAPVAERYYQELQQRRLNPRHHLRKILALSEIYGTDPVAQAIEDAFTLQAFSSEYIANILEQRQRILPEPGALLLTRRQDLLDLEMADPDLTIYDRSSADSA